MIDRFDSVVVGGGPAGSISALRLARLGWRTALIERGPRNRDKTCGHCLNARALQSLRAERLLEKVRRIAVGSTTSLRIHLSHRQPLETHSIGEGLLVQRSEFDQLLIDQAAATGVHVFQPANASIVQADDGPLVEVSCGSQRHRLGCRLIVGADGLGSTVARWAGLSRKGRMGRKFGFAFDVHQAATPSFQPNVIHMFVVDAGYVGVIQEAGEVHVAGLIGRQQNQSSRNPFTFTREAADQHDQLRELELDRIDRSSVRNFTAIGPMPWRLDSGSIANDSVALVGDAAGYVEPFTGEGMSWAIRSAQVLGDVLANATVGAWNRQLARHYHEAWRSHVGRNQRWCRLLAFTLARPRISSLAHRAGLQWPALTRRFVEQVVAP